MGAGELADNFIVSRRVTIGFNVLCALIDNHARGLADTGIATAQRIRARRSASDQPC
jgi:hypothetical protein